MANITFSRKDIEKHLALDEKNLDRISMFGTPIKISENYVEIEVFPNRPDLLSLHGFIRALSAFTEKEKGLKSYKIKKPLPEYKVKIDSSVKEVRPFTFCSIIKNLFFNDDKIKEIISLQEKLHLTLGRNRKKIAIGIYPLDKIHFPIKYIAKKPKDIVFIPLDSDSAMSAFEILEKNPAGRAYAHLLEGKDKFPIFIDSKKNILSMPPIINSIETGRISSETKEVFIECSGFDLALLKKTLAIITTALADQGGIIYSLELEYEKDGKIISPDFTPEKMSISLEDINKILGIDIKEKDIGNLLGKMGFGYSNKKALVPAWRCDILHKVDIVEDIAIAYGYQNFSPLPHHSPTIAYESGEYKKNNSIANILIGLNLQEISSYHLIKEEEAKRENIAENDRIEVENAKTEYKFLRPNLLIPALRMYSENKDVEYPQNIFEIGKIFKKDVKSETAIAEPANLLIAMSPANVTKIKEVLDYLCRMLSFNYELKKTNKTSLIEGRAASIYIKNKSIGYLGEIHPETLRDWNIKMPVAVLELALDEILEQL